MFSTLKPGTVVDSRYEIISHLGDGGMGSVFKARELGLERFVALKMLHPSLIGDKEHQDRFKREGAVLSKLEHPHILHCFRFGIWNATYPYIAMEFVQGKSLSTLIAESGPLSSARVLGFGQQICGAMEHAHNHNIIHRDLKPANIMVVQDALNRENIKVLDFGLAKVVAESGRASQHLTKTGDLIGSVYYMSPEQCVGKPCEVVSDVYSLGCLLYEALTGAPPLEADTPVGLMYLHVNTLPEPAGRKLPGVQLPAGLESVIDRALAKDPARRFLSMKQFELELELVASGQGTDIPRIETITSAETGKRRLFALVGAAAVIALAGLGVAAVLKPGPALEPTLPKARSEERGRVVQRTLNPGELYFAPTIDRTERIARIKDWLKKYGRTDLHGRSTALALLSLIYFERDGDRKLAKEYSRELFETVKTLMADKTATLRINSRQLETTMGLVREVLCRENGGFVGSRIFLRDYGPLVPDRLKDVVNAFLAGMYSSAGMYSDEMSSRKKLVHPGLQDQILYGLCLYRQNKLAAAKEAVGTFSRDAYAFYSEDYTHSVARALLEMGMVKQASTYLDFCLPRSIGSSAVMVQALGQKRTCSSPGTHARTEALILYLRKDYRGANRCIVRALARAPAAELCRYRLELLPLAVVNAEHGHLDVSAMLNPALKEASIADVGWIVRVAMACKKTDHLLVDQLLERCMQIVKANRATKPSDTQGSAIIAEALNATGRPGVAREFLMAILPSASKEGDALWMHIVLAKSALALKQFDDAERQLSLVKSDLYADGEQKDEIDRLVKHLRARVERARGRLSESCRLFEQLRVTTCNKPTVDLLEKIEILEDYANTCRLMKQNARAKELDLESRQLLPARCREPWRSWRPLIVVPRPFSGGDAPGG